MPAEKLSLHGLKPSSAHLVLSDEGTNTRAACVTFASFLDSNRSCRSADIRLNNTNREKSLAQTTPLPTQTASDAKSHL